MTNINFDSASVFLLSLIILYIPSISQNFNYTLDNWHIQANEFPGYMPETGFEGFAEFQICQKKLGSIRYFGQIKH